MNRYSSVLVVMLLVGLSLAEEEADLNADDVGRLPLKKIRQELVRRGRLCEGCLEKEHFAEALRKAINEGAALLSEDEQEEFKRKNAGGASKKMKMETGGDDGAATGGDAPKWSEAERKSFMESLKKKREENKRKKAKIIDEAVKG